METKEYLGKTLEVEIDRPFGSKHPKHGFIYPVNYGFVPNTVSGDGEELDCYVLGVFEPVDTFEGKCIAIIHRTNDDDDKLIVVPEGVAYTDDQIRALTEFQERFFESEIIRSKDYIEENWYRSGEKFLGNKEFLVQDPDGYLIRFSEDLGEK